MNTEIKVQIVNYVPYQSCSICFGQGLVAKPSYVPGDVDQWTSSDLAYTCNICNGKGIIPMHVIDNNKNQHHESSN